MMCRYMNVGSNIRSFFKTNTGRFEPRELRHAYITRYCMIQAVFDLADMETSPQKDSDVEKVADKSSIVHVTIDDTTRPERPSVEKIPSMQDIMSGKRVSMFGNLSFGKKKIGVSLVTPPKFQSLLQLGAHEASLELLHRYNILFLRSKLLLSLRSETTLMDEGTSEKVFQHLSRYCRSRPLVYLPEHLCQPTSATMTPT